VAVAVAPPAGIAHPHDAAAVGARSNRPSKHQAAIVCVLKSGIHATLAGVAAALLIPRGDRTHSPLRELEHMLHLWVTFAIMPIFVFAKALKGCNDAWGEVRSGSILLIP